MNIIRLLRDCVPADRFSRVTLLLTLPAAIVPLVPFAFSTSPVLAVYESIREISRGQFYSWELLPAGLASFSGWLVLASRLQLRVRKRFSKRDRSFFWVAAITSVVLSLSITGASFYASPPGNWLSYAVIFSAPNIVVAGAVLLVLRRQRHDSVDRDTVLALEVAFLAHAVLMTLMYCDFPAIGWWLTLVVVSGVIADIVSAALPQTNLGAPGECPTT